MVTHDEQTGLTSTVDVRKSEFTLGVEVSGFFYRLYGPILVVDSVLGRSESSN